MENMNENSLPGGDSDSLPNDLPVNGIASLTLDSNNLNHPTTKSPSQPQNLSQVSDMNGNPPAVGIASYFSDHGTASSFDFLTSLTLDPSASHTGLINGDSSSHGSVEQELPSAEDITTITSMAKDLSTADSPVHDEDDDESHAWIPSLRTRKYLECMVQETASIKDEEITTPRILMVDSLKDPTRELLRVVCGPEAAAERQVRGKG